MILNKYFPLPVFSNEEVIWNLFISLKNDLEFTHQMFFVHPQLLTHVQAVQVIKKAILFIGINFIKVGDKISLKTCIRKATSFQQSLIKINLITD